MRVHVTASSDLQEAEVLIRILRMAGHDVCLQNQSAADDLRPDAVICFGSTSAVVSSPVSHSKISVFSCELKIPRGFQGRAVVIPQPVDTRKFVPSPSQSFSSLDEKIIYAPGKLSPISGHKILMKAMTLVNPGIKAVISGREEKYTVKQMRELAERLGVGNRLEIWEKPEDNSSLISRAAVGVVTCLGIQQVVNPVLEILASGVPLLVTASHGWHDHVQDGVTALFHSPGNWRQLARQINYLTEDVGVAEMLSCNSRKYCERHFSYELVGNRWTEVLEQLSFG